MTRFAARPPRQISRPRLPFAAPLQPIARSAATLASPIESITSAVLRLQRDAGNQAVLRLIGRETAVEVKPVDIVAGLSAASIARARSFYHSKPKQYTPEIISQIREKVGLPAEGGVDDAMIKAVAAFQGDHNLKVDGMAGVRSLAVMFPSGLARESAEQAFVTAEKTKLAGWDALSPADRLNAIAAPAKEQLIAAELDASALPEYVTFPLTDANAVFEHETWKIHIREDLLTRPALTEPDRREMAELIYHESRHAEQHHKMARMRSAKGLDAEAIAKELTLPMQVATDAAAKPLAPGTPEFIVAEERFESEYGKGKASTKAAEADARAKKVRLEQAAKYAKEHPGDPAAKKRLLAAQAAFDQADARYRDLPLEADAYHVQDDVDFIWTEGGA